jgi:hypothetical protein
MVTAEVNSKTAAKVLHLEGWNGNNLGLQIVKRLSQPGKVVTIGKNGEIGVAAKFGCAVEHARLAAHEQNADAMRAHRRKDFAYRVRDQARLRAPGMPAIASRFPASAEQALAGTTRPIPLQPTLPAESLRYGAANYANYANGLAELELILLNRSSDVMPSM